ncbi:DUF6705 family protein [Mongoliitalea lutea]|uniref:DUF6705 domain-containing protein n=1 Tax=Mongoliitalea lutea TaxID=849756 RepID=A0A8J3D1R3_9BACT|nr:DUF6705 family protein [Mongoliitalea lutea]GHB54337.1 hypothetical protein GCM10008106_37920 [Mongoliitalea lutea]
MKNQIILIISLFISSLVVNKSSFAQSENKDLKELEGMWAYSNDTINYIVKLVEVNILVGDREEKRLIGFSKLKVKSDLLYDNLHRVEKFLKNRNVKSEVIFDTKNPENIPNIIMYSNSNIFFGDFTNDDKLKSVKITANYAEDKFIINFERFARNGKHDPDHIPKVPSTWVLQRVEE